jgi:hypothetical protein
MFAHELIANRKTENSQKLAKLNIRRAELKRDLIVNDPGIRALLRTQLEQATSELAEVEKQIAAIKQWEQPPLEKVQKLEQLQTRINAAQICRHAAMSNIEFAERNERPRALAEARAQLAEAEKDYARARKELDAALVKVGFAANAL